MLSLTKKSDAPVAAPLWHPNFRNFERLPDTKVVRTTFFVNTFAAAAAIALVLWLGYREYTLKTLAAQIAEAQAEIDGNAKLNAEALRLTQVFSEEDRKITEARTFMKSPVPPGEFIVLIGQTLPKEISIDVVDLRIPVDPKGQQYNLRGVVAGTREQASGSASSYVELLKAHPRLGTVFDPITLERLNPDGGNGFMSFEISLKVKPEGKK